MKTSKIIKSLLLTVALAGGASNTWAESQAMIAGTALDVTKATKNGDETAVATKTSNNSVTYIDGMKNTNTATFQLTGFANQNYNLSFGAASDPQKSGTDEPTVSLNFKIYDSNSKLEVDRDVTIYNNATWFDQFAYYTFNTGTLTAGDKKMVITYSSTGVTSDYTCNVANIVFKASDSNSNNVISLPSTTAAFDLAKATAVTTHSDANVSNGYLDYYQAGNNVTFFLNVTEAADYVLSFGESNNTDNYDGTGYVLVVLDNMDSNNSTITNSVAVPYTSSWTAYVNKYLFFENLPTGNYSLKFLLVGGGPRVTTIQMRKKSSTFVTLPATFTNDDYSKGTFNDGKYVDNSNLDSFKDGGTATYLLDVKYNLNALSFSGATPRTDAKATFTFTNLSTSAETSKEVTISQTSTNSSVWTTYQTFTASDFSLAAGQYQLVITMNSTSGQYTANVKDLKFGATVDLSEEATNTIYDCTADVTLTRSISKDKWSTIVLPFDIESNDVETIFGTGAKVAELTSSSNATTLNFTTTLTDNKMKANQPYAIKVATDFTSATINNVTIIAGTPTQTVGNWNFVGTYENGTIPDGSYYFSSNKLWQASGTGIRMKPFRAFFNSASGAREIKFLIDEDGQTTALGTLRADGSMSTQAEGMFYSISGQHIAKPTKGLYIVNGKKVIIK